MSTFNPSPGPWKFVNGCLYDADGMEITPGECDYNLDPDRVESNRRLIEGAMELLVRCKTMVAEFDIAHIECVFDGQIRAWHNARNTVAKYAEGGTT